jgi:hypothetical protein
MRPLQVRNPHTIQSPVRRLDATIKHDYRELNLGSNDLEEVSPQVFQMKSLETLILSLPAWCENSVGDGSIFMASGWPAKGHGTLLKKPL